MVTIIGVVFLVIGFICDAIQIVLIYTSDNLEFFNALGIIGTLLFIFGIALTSFGAYTKSRS